MRLNADGAEFFVAMERLVGFAMALPKRFNVLHLLVVFLCRGKKVEQPLLENIIRLRGFCQEFFAAWT
jgi:hypothetical protein